MQFDFFTLVSKLNSFIWGPPLLIALSGVGIYFTWLLRGLQFRRFGLAHKLSLGSGEKTGEAISERDSLMMSLAGTVGIGSIAGVATAIAIGGIGALFWLWVASFIGMVTKYAETVLGVRYRIFEKGAFSGGPMYYLEKGVKSPFLAKFFAAAMALSVLGGGNMVQTNAVAGAVCELLPVQPIWVGVILMMLTAVALLGGLKSMSRTANLLVPFMGILYLGGGGFILIKYASLIPATLMMIVKTAFTGQAAVGGFVGSGIMIAMQMGFSRGTFSSEIGLGTSAISSAAAKTDYPARLGLISIAGVFLTTGVVCTCTGLVIALTGVLGDTDADGLLRSGAPLAFHAFEKGFYGGGLVVTLSLIPFAFTTMIGWAYCGEKAFEYLFGEKSIVWYRWLFILLVIPGAVLDLQFIWSFANLMNGLMIFPNLIALIVLRREVVEETEVFFAHFRGLAKG